MRHDEDDVEFAKLSSSRFEELCFDLLVRAGFSKVVWRQGGGDSGRDIDASIVVNVPLVGAQHEYWAVECKHYTGGVPVEPIASKVAWAEAELPDRLIIIVSSHLTNPAREWLTKREAGMRCRVHVIEGKQLKGLILPYDDLVERYFADPPAKLLRQSVEQWALHGIYPPPQTLAVLTNSLPLNRLSPGELGFLWCMCLVTADAVEAWNEDNDEHHVAADAVKACLLAVASERGGSVVEDVKAAAYSGVSLRSLGTDATLHRAFSELIVSRSNAGEPAVYAIAHDGTIGLEVLISVSSQPDAVVRRFQGAVTGQVSHAVDRLDRLVESTNRARGLR